jgi:MoxR-like ATPase
MASNKLRLQSFRTNDLVNDGGKQFELGKSWCDDFFEFDKTRPEVVVNLKFKAIQMSHVSLNDKIIELKLADVSIRGDRKAYVNGNNGMSQIKDFFINDLHLTPENNLTDYFAIYKVSEFDYYLYFVPSLLYKNFLQFFKSVLPTVSINHNNEDLRTAEKASLQQIFYGAPGTGKSHIIKEQTKGEDVIRTTFHPDTDYSTFVGTYKPTTEFFPVLAIIGDKAVETGREEKRISYEFVCQAFLQAYVAAWKNVAEAKGGMPKKQFLVIEEINRGNCAQIFGDLFQLLDRNDYGYSDYPIQADADMRKQLKRLFGGVEIENAESINSLYDGRDIVQEVLCGEVLLLPNNLYIWATMNTSDQSLFPIDSAFKRRWDWVYMPIADAKKNYVIEIDNDQYDWWSFLKAINAIIESTIHSEDKKLGYFFAKAKDGRITVETFVSKVIFYLWNDVFKDNETNHKAFKDNDGELLPFRKFFNHDGTVDTNMVIKFLQDLEVFPFEHSDDGTTAVSDITPNTKRQRDKSRYRVNGTDNLNKAQMTREAFKLYIEAHPDADAQTIAQAWNGLGLKDYVQHLVETEAEFNARTKDSTDSNKRATEFELSNGEKIYLSTQFGIGNIGKFMDAVNNAGWNIRIENQD